MDLGRADRETRIGSCDQTRKRKRPRVALEQRKRASVACSNCRRLKERCDGSVPCARCLKHERACERLPADQRASDVSSSSDHTEHERLSLLESITGHFLGDVSLDTENLRHVVENIERQTPSTVQKPVGVYAMASRTDDPPIARAMGELSHSGFSGRLHQQVKHRLPSFELAGLKDSEIGVTRPKHLTGRPLDFDRADLPPYHIATFLSKVYFDYAQTVTNFAEPAWISAKIEELYDMRRSLCAEDSGWICAVLVASQKQGSRGADRIIADSHNGDSEADVGMALHSSAGKLLPDVIYVANDDSAQALLMLAHFALSLDAPGLAHRYLVLGSTIAGQHSTDANSGAAKHSGTFTYHVSLVMCSWERRLSILWGGYSCRTAAGTNAAAQVDSLEHGKLTEQHDDSFLVLTTWLERIAARLYDLRYSDKSVRGRHLERLLQTRKDYKQWWLSIPSSEIPAIQLNRPLSHLHIYHYINILFMGRPFIFASTDSPASYTLSSGPASSLPFAEDAEYAAYDIIEICARLDKSHGLSRASFLEYSSCRAAVEVMLARSLSGRCTLFREKLDCGLNLLRRMNPLDSETYSRSSIERLDAAIRQINPLDTRKTVDGGIACPVAETEYAKFRNWAQFRRGTNHAQSIGTPLSFSGAEGSISGLADFDWDLFGDAPFGLDERDSTNFIPGDLTPMTAVMS